MRDHEGREWRMVPVEATEPMESAGWIDKEDVCPCDIYAAMLVAAPAYVPSEAEVTKVMQTIFDASHEHGLFSDQVARAVIITLFGE